MIATHERDLRKNEYCKENNIPFVRIRFDQINEIEHILEDFISNNDEYLTQMNPYLSNDESIWIDCALIEITNLSMFEDDSIFKTNINICAFAIYNDSGF